MLQFSSLLEQATGPPSATELLRSFVPPPRFADKRFDDYLPDARHASQAATRDHLRDVAARMHRARPLARLRRLVGGARPGRGIYLDGGFGVGKTHLLAALWHAAPAPRAYLSFDELVYTIGLLGVGPARAAFRGHRLVGVDEWELDDPGNLKLALAWLRGALADGLLVAVTSNTVPDELGRGRFSQKSFAAEIEELAAAFEVLRIEGEDYRHRRFQADAGREYFRDPRQLRAQAADAGRVLLVRFDELLAGLGRVHPIRYDRLVARFDRLLVEDLTGIANLPDGLRWVHFLDKLYDSGVPLAASSRVPLSALFPEEFLTGGYGKKFSRCLSRMAELLGENDTSAEVLPGGVV